MGLLDFVSKFDPRKKDPLDPVTGRTSQDDAAFEEGKKVMQRQVEAYGEPFEPVSDQSVVEMGKASIKERTGYDVLGGAKELAKGLPRVPVHMVGKAIDTAQGQSGVDIVNPDFFEKISKGVRDWEKKRQAEISEKYQDRKFLPGIKVTDAASLPENLAYSLNTAAVGIGSGAAAAGATGGNPIAGYVTGMGAAGATAYRGTTNDFMREVLTEFDSQLKTERGKGLDEKEQAALKQFFEKEATETGLWEALPEAIGGGIGFKILTAPLKGILTKALGDKLGQKATTNILAKIAGSQVEELATETITEMGQTDVRGRVGLEGGKKVDWTNGYDWLESLKAVAPQTILLTSIMGGAVAGGNRIHSNKQNRILDKAISDGEHKNLPNDEKGNDLLSRMLTHAQGLQKQRPKDKRLSSAVDELTGEIASRASVEAPSSDAVSAVEPDAVASDLKKEILSTVQENIASGKATISDIQKLKKKKEITDAGVSDDDLNRLVIDMKGAPLSDEAITSMDRVYDDLEESREMAKKDESRWPIGLRDDSVSPDASTFGGSGIKSMQKAVDDMFEASEMASSHLDNIPFNMSESAKSVIQWAENFKTGFSNQDQWGIEKTIEKARKGDPESITRIWKNYQKSGDGTIEFEPYEIRDVKKVQEEIHRTAKLGDKKIGTNEEGVSIIQTKEGFRYSVDAEGIRKDAPRKILENKKVEAYSTEDLKKLGNKEFLTPDELGTTSQVKPEIKTELVIVPVEEPAAPGKPLTKREKATKEYTDYVAALTDSQKIEVSHLIEENPQSPSLQLRKLREAVDGGPADSDAQSLPHDPPGAETVLEKADDTATMPLLSPKEQKLVDDRSKEFKTKREKAMHEYNTLVAGLSTEQREAVSDLIRKDPPSPSFQIRRINAVLSKTKEDAKDKPAVHDYSSTQVDLPEKEAGEIRSFSEKIPETELYTDPKDPGYGRETEPHITVRYGMESIDPEEIAPAFKGVGPVRARLGKLSIFETDKYDVVKVDIESDDLRAANKKVGETVPVPGETFSDYQPHITVAYVKKGEGKKYIGDKSFEGKEITIDHVTLSAKGGKRNKIQLAGKPSPDPTEPASTPETKGKETPKSRKERPEKQKAKPPSKSGSDQAIKSLGKNKKGFPVFERPDGHRYYVESGIAIEAPRGFVLGANVLPDTAEQLFDKGRTEYLTVDELKSFETPAATPAEAVQPVGIEAELEAASMDDIESMFDDAVAEKEAAEKVKESPKKEAKKEPDAIKSGDTIRHTPKNKRFSVVEGTVVEQIKSPSGGIGYNVLTPVDGDPGKTSRVWENTGKIEKVSPAAKSKSEKEPVEFEFHELGSGRKYTQTLPADQKPATQSAVDILKKAADQGIKGLDEVTKGLFELFGGNSLKSFPGGLDKDAYAKAKPHFDAGFKSFVAAGKSLKDFIKWVVNSFGANVKPYLMHWIGDRKREKVDSKTGEGYHNNNNSKTGGKNAAVDDNGAKETGSAQDDRTGDGRKGSEDVSGAETVREAEKIPERSGTADDGKLPDRSRQGVRRNPQKPEGISGYGSAGGNGLPGSLAPSNRDVHRLQRLGDYRISEGELSRSGGWKKTAERNLDIIELVKKLESEKRPATEEEKAILVQYVGWGASEMANKLFPGFARLGKINIYEADEAWKPLIERMQSLLSEEEIKSAARSTQYAHYTSEPVIRSIYKALEGFGFKGGQILEPGSGAGHFLGLLPDTMKKVSKYTAIERDPISHLVTKYLYPNQNIIGADFIQQVLPDNFFDLAIGNPPFGSTTILADPVYKKNRFKLHEYFIAKSIDKVRPGGLAVFVSSRYAMDKVDDKARTYLAEKADLLGAIRLPQTAFKQNAGTDVVTDVFFLQKRMEGAEPGGESWNNLKEIQTEEGPALINEYFAAHPEMILGRSSLKGSMHRENEYTVLPMEGKIEDHFSEAIKNLPKNVFHKQNFSKKEETRKAAFERDFNPKNKKEGGVYLSEAGQLMVVESGSGVPISEIFPKLSANDAKWLKDYAGLRDAVKQAQYDQLAEGPWEDSLKELNRVYDDFVKNHGHVLAFTVSERTVEDEDGTVQTIESRRFKNKSKWNKDVENTLVTALERINEDTGEIVKAPILLGRTIKKPKKAEIKSAPDAMAVVLDETGSLDIDRIADLLAIDREQVIEQLGNLIYDAPGQGYALADEYLSGNVVQKLEEAKIAAAADQKYEKNVKALEDVQPARLSAENITVLPGAAWIPIDYYNNFVQEVLELNTLAVFHTPADNSWKIDNAIVPSRWSPPKKVKRQSLRQSSSEWSTPYRGANELFEAVLNNRTIKITRTVDKKTFVDESATAAANEVAKKMRQKFSTWIWTDAERANELLNLYNTKFNNLAPRRLDGTHLTFPGLSIRFKPYDHQKRGVWRIIQTGNTYLAHAVGAGKTFEMICAGMEMKRLGLIDKPVYTVPNHMLRQFANEFQEFYPMANVMVADEENFHTDNRRRFIAQATLNGPDAIIMTHSSFGLLKLTEESIAPIRQKVLDEMRASLEELEDDENSRFRVKAMEARIEQTEQRFDSMIAGGDKKDRAITFEEMGVDFLFVDEAHKYRKLDFTTNRQAKGIDPKGSVAAMDMYIKTKWLEHQRPGRSHVFASGTPVTNTMGELYTLMKFFIEDQMEIDGIQLFDSWANMFGEVHPDYEMNASGRYEIVERFSKFVNVPELMSRVRTFMDVLTMSQLGAFVKRPEIKGGSPEIVVVPANETLKAYQKDVLQPRIERSRKWKPSRDQKGNPDPLINIITDGRLASIDMRFVDSKAKSDSDSKLNVFIDDIVRSYKGLSDLEYVNPETGEPEAIKGGTQIVFYNHGFGAGVKARRGFDSRAWMMKRFKQDGIKPEVVAWIDDYPTAAGKEGVFKQMRSGEKRILIGSAKKMGTGVNVQRRLAVLHYLDPPWFPADVEQPDGRILRQGNQNKEVELKRYATKGSYDATMWQMVARKSKNFEQAFIGDSSVRTIDDISESSQYAMAAALASGDERVIQLVGLKADIERLSLLDKAHYKTQNELRYRRREYEYSLKGIQDTIATLQEAKKQVGDGYVKTINGVIDGKSYDSRTKFGERLLSEHAKMFRALEEGKSEKRKAATLQGIDVFISSGGLLGERIELRVNATDVLRTVRLSDESSPKGVVDSLVNAINSIDSTLRDRQHDIDDTNAELKIIEKRIGAPFEFARELAEKTSEAKQIEEALAAEGAATAKAAAGAAVSVEELIPDEKEGDGSEEQYSVQSRTPGQDLSVKDIQSIFKRHEVGLSNDGSIWVKTRGGNGLIIKTAKWISADKIAFEIGYGRMKETGEMIAGKYLNSTITLNKYIADKWTVLHELEHWAEDIGLLSALDIAALNKAITKEQGIDSPSKEDRAKYVDRELLARSQKGRIGRIIQRIQDFIDALVNLAKRTGRGVVRSFESGKVFDRTGDELSTDLRKGAPRYSVKKIDKDLQDDALSAIEYLKAISKKPGLTKSGKEDLSYFNDLLLSIPAFFKDKIPAVASMFQATQDRQDRYHENVFNMENHGVMNSIKALGDLRKADENGYKQVAAYLVSQDRDRAGYRVVINKVKKTFDLLSQDKKKVIGSFTNEPAAIEAAIKFEVNDLEKSGFNPQQAQAVAAFRMSTNKGFDMLIGSMKALIAKYAELGMDIPPVVTVVNGENVEISFETAMAMMGDMRGYYFPRNRKKGKFVLTAFKEEEKELHTFNSMRLMEAEKVRLEKKGYSVQTSKNKQLGEDVFDMSGELIKTQQLVNAALEKISAKNTAGISEGEIKEMFNMTEAVFASAMAEQIANVIRERGSRVHMTRRSDDFFKGYNEDPETALAEYVRSLSGGEAKRDMIVKMLRAFTGTEVSWSEFKEQNPEAEFTDYKALVDSKMIDQREQPNAFKWGKAYLSEVTRNREFSDEVIGTIKGLAVAKYLAFRVFSAPLVNLTALATSVPASMKGAGIPLRRAPRLLASAINKYRQLKTTDGSGLSEEDKEIFQKIELAGWDNPQFNSEALNVLRSRLKGGYDKVLEYGMFTFSESERLNRVVTLFAAYKGLKVKNPKLSMDELLEKAKQVSDDSHGIYNKGNYPFLAMGNNPAAQVVKMFYVFRTFAHTYLLNMKKLGFEQKDYGALTYMLLAPAILAGAGASVLTALVSQVLSMVGMDDPEEDLYLRVGKQFGPGAEDFARFGLAGVGGHGITVKGSMAIGVGDLPTSISDILGAPGSVLSDIFIDGIPTVAKGDIAKGFEKILPTGMGNLIRAYRERVDGLTTRTNAPVFYGQEQVKLTPVETFYRALSLNPARVAGIREKQWKGHIQESQYSEQKADIYNKLRKFYLGGGQDLNEYAEIMAEIYKFNEAATSLKISPITKKSIRTVVKRSFRPSRRERLRAVNE